MGKPAHYWRRHRRARPGGRMETISLSQDLAFVLRPEAISSWLSSLGRRLGTNGSSGNFLHLSMFRLQIDYIGVIITSITAETNIISSFSFSSSSSTSSWRHVCYSHHPHTLTPYATMLPKVLLIKFEIHMPTRFHWVLSNVNNNIGWKLPIWNQQVCLLSVSRTIYNCLLQIQFDLLVSHSFQIYCTH